MKTIQTIMAAFTTSIKGVACEELTMANILRASGNGTNPKESFAKNIAVINAKAALGRAICVQVNGMINSFNQQHNADDMNDYTGKESEIAEGYFEQFMTNVSVICSNTYVKPDGTCHVYVCVEMGGETLSAMHKKLSEDKKIPIDFSEHRFTQEIEKAREKYRKQFNGH